MQRPEMLEVMQSAAREAGGVVESLAGGQASYTDSTVLCGTPKVVAAMREVFNELDPALLT